MSYKKICTEGVYEIWHGEGEFMPWRVSIGGSGTYFSSLKEMVDYIYGEDRQEVSK